MSLDYQQQPAKKPKSKTSHLATKDTLDRFLSMGQKLVDIVDNVETYEGAEMNHIMILNVRNVKWHRNRSGRQKMQRLDNSETHVTIMGRDKKSLVQCSQSFAKAVLNKSTPQQQIEVTYVTNSQNLSLKDSFEQYRETIEAERDV